MSFDEGTEQLYQIDHNTSSLSFARFGILAAITIYYATAFLEAYLLHTIDTQSTPWLLIHSVTAVSLGLLYSLTYFRYFVLRLDIIVLLAAVILSCQHSVYFSYYKLNAAFSLTFSQAIVINLLAIVTPDFKTMIKCSIIMLVLPIILTWLFNLEHIILFDTHYYLAICIGVAILNFRFLDSKNRQAFLLKEELLQEKKLMEDQANKDSLTGCFNRRYFTHLGEMELQRAIRFRHSLSLITIDIDHFKNINDTYGHPVGDKVIIDVAKLCQTHIRAIDTFARLGGEEFAVILPETDLVTATEIAERLRIQIEELNHKMNENEVVNVTISLGVASLEQSDKNLSNLINRSDEALYHSKDKGRNRTSSL